MYFIVETQKSFSQASSDLDASVKKHGFGLLHTHDLGETLRTKGVQFGDKCKIFEVCNPQQAAKVLSADMRLNMALPCRISVYTEKGKTYIGLIKPEKMLSSLSDKEELKIVASQVEREVIEIVNDAK